MEQPDNILDYLNEKAQLINVSITKYLPTVNIPVKLRESMEYSLTAGGKRIRPILALTTYEAFGNTNIKDILPIVINLELLHTYSLIHDDLPAMDNDDYRRGKLTNHKVYGEAIAILAGDALLTHAFGNMAKYLKNLPQITLETSLQIIEEFAFYTGASGMVGGQAADLEGEKGKTTFDDLIYIHTHKTADLIVYSIRLGALLAGANNSQLERLTTFGEKIGLAFQIQDDILDIIGDTEKLGKKIGSDQLNNKVTYPVFKGIDTAKQEVEQMVAVAKELIDDIGLNTYYLQQIADFIVFREK